MISNGCAVKSSDQCSSILSGTYKCLSFSAIPSLLPPFLVTFCPSLNGQMSYKNEHTCAIFTFKIQTHHFWVFCNSKSALITTKERHCHRLPEILFLKHPVALLQITGFRSLLTFLLKHIMCCKEHSCLCF